MSPKQLFEYQARAEMFGWAGAPPIYLGRTDATRAIVERRKEGQPGSARDSFPASDPLDLGVDSRHRDDPPVRLTTGSVHNETAPREPINDVVILEGGSTKRSLLQRLMTLTGVMGLALLVPVAILLVGLPVALGVRGIVEAVAWLAAFVSK